MASKRELKKNIKRVCGDMVAELHYAAILCDKIDPVEVLKLVKKIAQLQVSTLGKVTFAFDKTPKDFAEPGEYKKAHRAYFKAAYDKLEKEFVGSVMGIVKEMNELVPAEIRKAAK